MDLDCDVCLGRAARRAGQVNDGDLVEKPDRNEEKPSLCIFDLRVSNDRAKGRRTMAAVALVAHFHHRTRSVALMGRRGLGGGFAFGGFEG